MYKIIITSDSNKHFEIPILEYIKRLWKTCEVIKIKPIKNWTDKQIIESETVQIIEKLEKLKWFKIVLSPKWKNFNTIEFYDFVENKKQTSSDTIFIIWWALGFDYDKLNKYIDLELSLWFMTMPHSLALLVILEQIYRLEMIKKWTNYNK